VAFVGSVAPEILLAHSPGRGRHERRIAGDAQAVGEKNAVPDIAIVGM
jgi:hypothetical protein